VPALPETSDQEISHGPETVEHGHAHPSSEGWVTHLVGWWDGWYETGHGSGPGSLGALGSWKAAFVDQFVAEHDIKSVIEWGCGDGSQLSLAHYPDYTGYDVSEVALDLCRAMFKDDPTKRFVADATGLRAELALSLDVAYHLVDQDVYDRHIKDLFASATRYVVLYTTPDHTMDAPDHILHRDAPDGWVTCVPNPVKPNACTFYTYKVGT